MGFYDARHYQVDGYTAETSILGDLTAFDVGALVELYVLDLTSLGDTVYYFHCGLNEKMVPVVWQGVTYQPLPIEATGFDRNGAGAPARPKLQVANAQGFISSYVMGFNQLLGAKVIRKRTLLKYLDAVNFTSGVNPTADPEQFLPDDVYFIAQKTSENLLYCEFELSSALDLTGVQLPRRQVIANICPWKYRGEACGYTGTAYFDQSDNPVALASADVCAKRLTSCKKRWGVNVDLPYGGFPAAALITS